MSDVAIAPDDPRKPPARTTAQGLAITPRVRRAVELMVWDGKRYAEAAAETGLTARAMRLALERPHVLAYLRSQQQVLRSSEGPRSIHRLAEIRDAADNMPAVTSARELLTESESHARSSTSAATPGVVIHIHQPITPERVIEGRPHEPPLAIDIVDE